MSMIRSAPSRILNRIIPPPLDLRYRHIAEYIYRVFARINRLNTHTQTLSIRVWRTEISTVMVGERVLSISLDVLYQDISLTPQKCRVTWRTALHQQSMWSIIFDKTYLATALFHQMLACHWCWSCDTAVSRDDDSWAGSADSIFKGPSTRWKMDCLAASQPSARGCDTKASLLSQRENDSSLYHLNFSQK